MTNALQIDCTKEPVSFYDAVTDARVARQGVRDSIDRLTGLIKQYQQEVQAFEAQHFSSQTGDEKS
jgi:predicted DNA-binding protein YlxM (UPF0122 family)